MIPQEKAKSCYVKSAKDAFNDITTYLKASGISIMDGLGDVWTVTPATMYTVETRQLNRLLGLHRINKFHRNEISSFEKLQNIKRCKDK